MQRDGHRAKTNGRGSMQYSAAISARCHKRWASASAAHLLARTMLAISRFSRAHFTTLCRGVCEGEIGDVGLLNHIHCCDPRSFAAHNGYHGYLFAFRKDSSPLPPLLLRSSCNAMLTRRGGISCRCHQCKVNVDMKRSRALFLKYG